MRQITQGLPAVAIACVSLLLAACGGSGGDRDDGDSSRLNEASCSKAYFATTPADPVTGPDPLAPAQWHLKNTGQSNGTPGEDLNVEGAWQVADGAGVRIAVVDSGIEVVHEDLLPNIIDRKSTRLNSSHVKISYAVF